ncbi:MAG: hypothetical protein M5U07_23215 [Xanthobacteraceae bacterium]|nr:hypothetical protein [Xanthobacteraceae bacterium]
MRVEIRPALLRWAQERASLVDEELMRRFPKFSEWMEGTANPTLKQLEQFARFTHTPIGYLFLPEPPVERVPIPDFRRSAPVESNVRAQTCSTPSTSASSGKNGIGISCDRSSRTHWRSWAR